MQSKIYFLLLAGLLLISMQLFSQATIRNGQFELQIDLGMSENEQMEFALQYDIDSLIMQAVFQKNFDFINDSTQWRAKILKPDLVLLTKNLSLENDGIKQSFLDIVLSHLLGSNDDPPLPPPPGFADYGVNKLSSHRAFRIIDGQACFMLTSYMNAKKVMLAGSFNNWNTMNLPMQKTDSGWVTCLSLEAGKYTYKYIVDGRWMADPGNLQEENNDQGTTNSIVFVYNYAFEL
ncbi:MAG: glycogen-binding domain-containing protein, partial [Bacteroidales bacterium]|nr:glycogen-binding domain-containing protein [Bacteroidales bacterium]